MSAKKNAEKIRLDSEAALKVKRMHRKQTIKQVVFWTVYVVGAGALLLLAASSQALTNTNVLASVVLLAPLALLIVPVIYGYTQYANAGEILLRTLIVLVAMAVMFIGLLLVIFSRVAEPVWVWLAGSAIYNQPGFLSWIPWAGQWLGMVISFALAFVLPVVLFRLLVRTLTQEKVNWVKVILLAFFTSLTLLFAIGMSITNNAGF